MKHLDWYRHHHLPHCDQPGKIQSITIRLHDSMPAKLLRRWREELAIEEAKERIADVPSASGREGPTRRRGSMLRRIESYLDAGHGSCHLRDPRIAQMVQESLFFGDGERYRLLAWVIMPNHLHFAMEMQEGWPLGVVMKGFKRFTAGQANAVLDREGRFWYPDYRDRYVRDRAHLNRLIRYIHQNPVKAGLVANAEDWEWSSARVGARETTRELE